MLQFKMSNRTKVSSIIIRIKLIMIKKLNSGRKRTESLNLRIKYFKFKRKLKLIKERLRHS